MSTKHVIVAVGLLSALSTFGCSGTSPIAPSPPVDIAKPADGTQVASFPLPGTSEPLEVWVTGFSPGKEAQLTEGQTISFGFTCNGPVGYEAVIGLDLVTDSSEPLPINRSGALVPVAGRCGGHRMSASFVATKGMPNKNYFRIMVWVGKIPELQQWTPPPDPPDFYNDQWVGYKSPR